MNPDRDYEFWRAHDGVGLVWSNSNASDSVMIANALLRPNFHLLLDIAVRFGLARLESEWSILKSGVEANQFPEELRRMHRATPLVERSLLHMNEGIRSQGAM